MTYPLKSAALLLYGQVPPNPVAEVNEAFLDGKKAAHKERAAKATAGNKNRPELLALPAATAAVCARHGLKPVASEKFTETIRAEVRREVLAAVDSKTKKMLLSRKPEWPSASVIKRVI